MHVALLFRHRARRLRRAALVLLALGGLATVLGGGCSAPFDQPSDINSLRVLAVTLDKPYADPGDSVTFQIEYFDGYVDPDHPNDGPRPVQILWLGGCVDPVADSYFACYAELAKVFEKIQEIAGPNPDLADLIALEEQGLLGTHDKFTVPIPKDIVSRRPTPDTGPHYGIAYVFFIACAGTVRPVPPEGSGRAGSFPIGCFDESGNRLGAESFVAGYTQVYSFEDKRPNDNPAIHDLLIDGSPFQVGSTSGSGAAGGSGTTGGSGGEAGLGGTGGSTGSAGSGGEAGAGGACGSTTGAGGGGPSVGGGGAGTAGGASVQGTTVKRCPLTDEERRIQGCAAKDPYTECRPYEIKVDVSSSIAETDPDSSGPDGKTLTESVWVDYYATRGDFESNIRLVNDPTTGFNDDLGTRWIPPSEPGLVNIWAVVHDSRGGASVISRQVLVSCDTNADCSDKGLVCDTTTGGCVTCVSDPDCGDETRFVCLDHTCLPSCSSDADCLDGVCRARRCVRCQSNADCSEKRPICDSVSGNCVECAPN